jgi:hypothetical protein
MPNPDNNEQHLETRPRHHPAEARLLEASAQTETAKTSTKEARPSNTTETPQ